MARITKKQLEAKIYELEKDIHSLVRGDETDKLRVTVKWELAYKIEESHWYGDSDAPRFNGFIDLDNSGDTIKTIKIPKK